MPKSKQPTYIIEIADGVIKAVMLQNGSPKPELEPIFIKRDTSDDIEEDRVLESVEYFDREIDLY